MFRTVPLSINRNFSLYTQQWYMSYRFTDSLRAGSGRNWFGPADAATHWPWGPPGLLHSGYRVFPGGKAAGAWR